MKNYKLIVVILFVCICSCTKNKTLKEFYTNNNIKKEVEIINDSLCIVTNYFENGNLHSKYSLLNDKIDGEFFIYDSSGYLYDKYFFIKGIENGYSYSYFPTGEICAVVMISNGKKIGNGYYYDKSGKIEWINHYVMWDTVSWLNEVYCFNTSGDTIKEKSNYFKFNCTKDTINIDEDFEFELNLEAPHFKNSKMQVYITDYDKLFEKNNTSEYLIFECDGYKFNYKVKPKNKNNNILKGIIREIDTLNNLERVLLFQKEYFVTE